MRMKRITNTLLLLFTVLLSLHADPVSPEEARKTALQFMKIHAGEDVDRGIDRIIAHQLDNGMTGYYYVTLDPTGWIIVSGDDAMLPVIGYSFKNPYVPHYQLEESAKKWFEAIDLHIVHSLEKPGLPVHDAWSGLYEETSTKSASANQVDPLINVNWNQDQYWNQYCPEDPKGPGGHAYVGCVAVSMAQAMSVYEYPVRPQGEHGYTSQNYGYIYVNYDDQPAYDWSSMSASSADAENARLLYHLAVAVDMGFSATGSGAYTRKAPGVMKQYFGYSESLAYHQRSSYDNDEWKQMIIDELAQGRPDRKSVV